MAETNQSNPPKLTTEQQEAINHYIIQEAKEKFSTRAAIDSIAKPAGALLSTEIQQWENAKRQELLGSSTETLNNLVKEHKKFLEIKSLDKDNDKKIDKNEAVEFVAHTLKDATRNLNISGESLAKNEGHYSEVISEIQKIAAKHGLTMNTEAAEAGLDSYNETSKIPRPKQKPETQLG